MGSLLIQKSRLGALLILCCLLPGVCVFAQEQRQTKDRANEAYIRYEYAVAAELYEKITKQKNSKDSIAIFTRLADCYRELNRFEEAAKYYGILVNMQDAPVESHRYYGDVLKNLEQYAAAKDAYKRYLQKKDTLLTKELAGCDSALNWMAHPSNHTLQNLKGVNTGKSDWGAVWYGKNNQIVFVSDSFRTTQMLSKLKKSDKRIYGRTSTGFQKIYVVDTNSRGLDMNYIHDFSPSLNGFHFHTGPVVFSPGFDTAYFTLTSPILDDEKTKRIRIKGRNVVYGTRRLEVFVTEKDTATGEWGKPHSFAHNKPELYSIGHIALSKDGNLVYFTSNMPGGQGGLDIWYSEKKADGSWSDPQNCGAVINTAADEGFATTGNGNTVYFSSKGHTGMGGFDLFRTTGSKNNWDKPVNMGYPVNSGGDDFYYTAKDNRTGFLSSNRKGGEGSDDIYTFSLPEPPKIIKPLPVLVLENTVFDSSGRVLTDSVNVTLRNTAKNISWRTPANINGKNFFILEANTSYFIRASRKGYLPDSTSFVSPAVINGMDTIYTKLHLRKPIYRVGFVFKLENLYYAYNKSDIRPDAALVLDTLVMLLNQHPSMKIELSSHTDSRGGDAYNYALSDRRAKSAVQYLISKGIAADRLVARGYGETRLVNNCANGVACSEPDHQMNRRTEVKVLKIDEEEGQDK